MVGGWNTAFGISLFWLFHMLWPLVHYLILLVVANEISILNAYVGYRLFVFRSQESIAVELFRFHGVYLASACLGIALTALLVEGVGLGPVMANAISVIITIVASYVGHRHFSFRKPYRPQ